MPKVFTMFKLGQCSTPKDPHVTHRYFGEMDIEQVRLLLDVLNVHFYEKPFKAFKCTFDRTRYFTNITRPEKPLRVLLPLHDGKFRKSLRMSLDAFFPLADFSIPENERHSFPFCPHVTSESISAPLYAMVEDYWVVADGKAIWSATNHAKVIKDARNKTHAR